MAKEWRKRRYTTSLPEMDDTSLPEGSQLVQPILAAAAPAAAVAAEAASSSSSSSRVWQRLSAAVLGLDAETVENAAPETTLHVRPPDPPAEAPEDLRPKPLQGLLKRKFLNNTFSGKDVGEIAHAARSSGAQGVDRLAQIRDQPSNAARDALRACLQGCTVPAVYYDNIRVKDPSTQEVRLARLPFLLPHEVIPAILAKASQEQKDKWLMHPTRNSEVQAFCLKYNQSPQTTYPIGLHGDGVPFKAKMQDSIEQYSWTFCSDPGSPRNLFTAVPKSFCSGRDTHEDILKIFTQSMVILSQRNYPSVRLDGQAWIRPEDNLRAKLQGDKLGCGACLIELRGDWAYYNQVFGFPSWASHRICWTCTASKTGETSFKDTGPCALWRIQRLSSAAFLQQQAQNGIQQSIIFTAPGCTVDCVRIDWLHCMDLGVTQTVLGNALWEIQELLQGATIQARTSALWQRLKAYYKRARPTSQFQSLTVEMLRQPGKGPKLRGKAAETRCCVPFAVELVAEFSQHSYHMQVVHETLQHLHQLYLCIDMNPYPAEEAAAESLQLAQKLVALQLEAEHHSKEQHWKLKPKLHCMQELIEVHCLQSKQSPRQFWTYADETWGGVVANMARRRGGAKSPEAIGESLMSRYRAWVNET
jgi:hypothetical protein